MRERRAKLTGFIRSFRGAAADGRPICRRINESCIAEGQCVSRSSGSPCWLVQDVACCPRNDKSRCCYCRVYLAYLDFKQTGRLRTVPMESIEDPRFSEMGRRLAAEAREKGTEIVFLRGNDKEPSTDD